MKEFISVENISWNRYMRFPENVELSFIEIKSHFEG